MDSRIGRFDFEPVDGSYNLRRHNFGPNGMTAAHVEYYRIILEVLSAPPAEEKFNLQIVADGGQAKIGIVEVTLPQGSKTPQFRYRANAGAQATPSGISDLTNGRFWLACTSPNGHPRGNAFHASGTGSSVRMRMGFEHDWQSTAHTINCVF
jgi:hypothetical protein